MVAMYFLFTWNTAVAQDPNPPAALALGYPVTQQLLGVRDSVLVMLHTKPQKNGPNY